MRYSFIPSSSTFLLVPVWRVPALVQSPQLLREQLTPRTEEFRPPVHVERSPPRFKAPAHPLSSQSRSRRKRRLHHRPAPENTRASLRSANHPRLTPLPLPESGLVISVLRQAPPPLRETGSHLPRRGPLREQLAQENKGAYLPRPELRLVFGDQSFRIPGHFRSGKGPRPSRLGTLREPPAKKKKAGLPPAPRATPGPGRPPLPTPRASSEYADQETDSDSTDSGSDFQPGGSDTPSPRAARRPHLPHGDA